MLKIKNIEYDTEDYQGCETCDYGSKYIDEFKITFDNEEVMEVKTTQEYEHAFSESDLIKISSKEYDKIEDFKKEIIKVYIEHTYSFQDNELIINGNEIKLQKGQYRYEMPKE